MHVFRVYNLTRDFVGHVWADSLAHARQVAVMHYGNGMVVTA